MVDTPDNALLYGILLDIRSDIKRLEDKVDGIADAQEEHIVGQLLDHTALRQNRPSSIYSSTTSLNSTSEDGRLRQDDIKTRRMSEAFQINIENIIKGVPFEIVQDMVVSGDLVQEEETKHFSEFRCNRDRMRFLVTNIMEKSMESMKNFLEIIGECNPSVKDSIQDAYRSLSESKHIDQIDECTACQIQRQVDIFVVADPLFSQGAISLELYKTIANAISDADKAVMWPKIFQTLSQMQSGHSATVLKNALSQRAEFAFYRDIEQRIDRDVSRNRKSFRCRCKRAYLPGRTLHSNLSASMQSITSVETNLSGASTSSNSSNIGSFRPAEESSWTSRQRMPGGSKPVPSQKIIVGVFEPIRENIETNCVTSTNETENIADKYERQGARPKSKHFSTLGSHTGSNESPMIILSPPDLNHNHQTQKETLIRKNIIVEELCSEGNQFNSNSKKERQNERLWGNGATSPDNSHSTIHGPRMEDVKLPLDNNVTSSVNNEDLAGPINGGRRTVKSTGSDAGVIGKVRSHKFGKRDDNDESRVHLSMKQTQRSCLSASNESNETSKALLASSRARGTSVIDISWSRPNSVEYPTDNINAYKNRRVTKRNASSSKKRLIKKRRHLKKSNKKTCACDAPTLQTGENSRTIQLNEKGIEEEQCTKNDNKSEESKIETSDESTNSPEVVNAPTLQTGENSRTIHLNEKGIEEEQCTKKDNKSEESKIETSDESTIAPEVVNAPTLQTGENSRTIQLNEKGIEEEQCTKNDNKSEESKIETSDESTIAPEVVTLNPENSAVIGGCQTEKITKEPVSSTEIDFYIIDRELIVPAYTLTLIKEHTIENGRKTHAAELYVLNIISTSNTGSDEMDQIPNRLPNDPIQLEPGLKVETESEHTDNQNLDCHEDPQLPLNNVSDMVDIASSQNRDASAENMENINLKDSEYNEASGNSSNEPEIKLEDAEHLITNSRPYIQPVTRKTACRHTNRERPIKKGKRFIHIWV